MAYGIYHAILLMKYLLQYFFNGFIDLDNINHVIKFQVLHQLECINGQSCWYFIYLIWSPMYINHGGINQNHGGIINMEVYINHGGIIIFIYSSMISMDIHRSIDQIDGFGTTTKNRDRVRRYHLYYRMWNWWSKYSLRSIEGIETVLLFAFAQTLNSNCCVQTYVTVYLSFYFYLFFVQRCN